MTEKRNLKAGVLYFPGTNCETDLVGALEQNFGVTCELLWHTQSFDTTHDLYFVPGGFSYGDYLRSGALAARSTSLKSLHEAAKKGILITGICNGFQILTESGLLPGALIRNKTLKHVCRWVELEPSGDWKNKIQGNFSLPVSHSEGNFISPPDILKKIEDNNQVILKYNEDINGSTKNIAGISSENGRVLGLMPHPERALHETKDFSYTNSLSGYSFFNTLFDMI
jgi:phosphoribosylformylglycinamidine synthase